MRSFSRLAALLVAAAAASACAPLAPYRTEAADASLDCTANGAGEAPAACRAKVLERTASYDLMFVEFDDQGLQYPSERYGDAAAYQITNAMSRLRLLASAHKGLSLVVFVHGWKHNAAADDTNLRDFRKLLDSAALIEESTDSGYRVVGLYVSWRGLSNSVFGLRELSFWTRKNAALHVAQGSSRELFARLRGFKCVQNAGPGKADCNDRVPGERPKVRMIMIGHSFGALVLFNAVSGSLVESLTHADDSGDPADPSPRYGDLIVLVNPAFEATRYTPLHRIATLRDYSRYQTPLLVSLTSTADVATSVFFPLGRFFNTVFQRVTSDEEGLANTRTIGHMDAYLTHHLSVTSQPASHCDGWASAEALQKLPTAERRERLRANLLLERGNAEAFFGDSIKLPDGWVRHFCGETVLKHRQHKPNSLVWNVSADPAVIKDHSEISNPALWSFLRQLYSDTIMQPFAVSSWLEP